MDRVHVGELVLPLTLSQLTEEVFVQVCEERWSETQTLEFKAVLPKGDEDARQEFRKDVCALANADGGDLVSGIGNVNGCANAVLAINGAGVDATKRRLQQILESKVEPRIQSIQFHACPIAAGGFVLVLRIPSSDEGPHRFGPVTEHRFPIRNDSSTTDMTYEQLRNTFGRESTLLEKAAQGESHRFWSNPKKAGGRGRDGDAYRSHVWIGWTRQRGRCRHRGKPRCVST